MKDFLMRPMSILPGVKDFSIKHAEGCYLFDDKGTRFLDAFAANGNVLVGHAEPSVRKAHTSPRDDIKWKLEEALEALKPGYLDYLIYAKSGTQAIQKACKLSRKFRNKDRILAISEDMCNQAFIVSSASGNHGFEAMFSVSTNNNLINPRPSYKIPGLDEKVISTLGKSCKGACLCSLESFLMETASTTAAIIIDPSIGVGGSIEPCNSFFGKLDNFCRSQGVDLISNELQCGLGRAGSRIFGFQLLNIHPDIVCLGSNTANGYPLGAMMMAEHFADTEKSREEVSLASCSAAVATLGIIHQHGLPRKAEQLGNFIKNKIAELVKDSDEIKGIRGLGLMIEIEFFNEISALKFHQTAFRNGLVTGVGNVRKRIIRLTPPLTIDGNMAEELLSSFAKAFELIF